MPGIGSVVVLANPRGTPEDPALHGEAFPQVLPPSLTPAASTGKRCGGTDATLPPTHPGRARHCAGTRQVEGIKPGPSCGGDAGKALASLPLCSGRSSVPLLCSLVSNDDGNSENLYLFP